MSICTKNIYIFMYLKLKKILNVGNDPVGAYLA